MNLKFIDRVIKAYEADLPEGDMKRLRFFYGLWEDMDRWSKGPTTAEKHYAVPPKVRAGCGMALRFFAPNDGDALRRVNALAEELNVALQVEAVLAKEQGEYRSLASS